MTAPKNHVVAEVLALGTPDVPFTFTPTQDGAVGVWDYADARWAGLMSVGTVDREYQLHVELYDDGTYSLVDRTTATESRAGASGASFSRTTFRGTVRTKSFSSNAAPVASDHGQTGHTYGWRFDSEEMKAPVRAVLERNGWTARKRGFWATLTGRA